jgi:hypothetical protein
MERVLLEEGEVAVLRVLCAVELWMILLMERTLIK